VDETAQRKSRLVWLHARDEAVKAAERLQKLDLDKSRVNRLLEPFMWHTAIITATDWSNFFALRCNPAAQPEMKITADLMRAAHTANVPRVVKPGEWHLPLVDLTIPYSKPWLVSASRCARVSYNRQTDNEDLGITLGRADTLKKAGHLSPFEHPAKATGYMDRYDNFRGWESARHQIPYQWDHSYTEKGDKRDLTAT
jgi:hypothetical protein